MSGLRTVAACDKSVADEWRAGRITTPVADVTDAGRYPAIAEASTWLAAQSAERRAHLSEGWPAEWATGENA